MTQQCTVQPACLWQCKGALPPHWQKCCKSWRIRPGKMAQSKNSSVPLFQKSFLHYQLAQEKVQIHPQCSFLFCEWFIQNQFFFSRCISPVFFHSICWSINHSLDPHSQAVQDQRFCWPEFEVDIQGRIKRGEYPREVLPWGFSPSVLLLSPSETSWVTICCCASSVHFFSMDLSHFDTMQTCALKINHSFSAVPSAPVQS